MKPNRIAALCALVVCLYFGAGAFLPASSACSGTMPGSCVAEQPPAGQPDNNSTDSLLSRVFAWLEGLV